VTERYADRKSGDQFGVIPFAGATGFFRENVVDVFEGLFETKPTSFLEIARLTSPTIRAESGDPKLETSTCICAKRCGRRFHFDPLFRLK
jgi:hypothetical protein